MWKNQLNDRSDRSYSRRSGSPRIRRKSFARSRSPRNNTSSKRRISRSSTSPSRKQEKSQNKSQKLGTFGDRYFHKGGNTNRSKTSTVEFSNHQKDFYGQNYRLPQHKMASNAADIDRKVIENTTTLQWKQVPVGPQDHKDVSIDEPNSNKLLNNSLSAGCKFLSGTCSTGNGFSRLINEPVILAPTTILVPKLADNPNKNFSSYSSELNTATGLEKAKISKKEKHFNVVCETINRDSAESISSKPKRESTRKSKFSSNSTELDHNEADTKTLKKIQYIEHESMLTCSPSVSFQHGKAAQNSNSCSDNKNSFDQPTNSSHENDIKDDYHHRNDCSTPASALDDDDFSPCRQGETQPDAKEISADYFPSYLKNYDIDSMLFKNSSHFTSSNLPLFPTPYMNKQVELDDDLPCYSWVGELLDHGTKSSDNVSNDGNAKEFIPEEYEYVSDKDDFRSILPIQKRVCRNTKNARKGVSEVDSSNSLKDSYSLPSKVGYDHLQSKKSYSIKEGGMYNDNDQRSISKDFLYLDQEYYASKIALESYDNPAEKNLHSLTKNSPEIKSVSAATPKKSILKKPCKKTAPLAEENSYNGKTSTYLNNVKIENKLMLNTERSKFSNSFEGSLPNELRENLIKVSKQSIDVEVQSQRPLPFSNDDVPYTEKISKYASGWKKAMFESFTDEKEVLKEEKSRNMLSQEVQKLAPISRRMVIKRDPEISDKREVEFQEKMLKPQSRTFLDRDVEKSLGQSLSQNTRVVVPISRPLVEAKQEDGDTLDSLIKLQKLIHGKKHTGVDLQESGFLLWGKQYMEWFSKNVLSTSQFQHLVKTGDAFKGKLDPTEIPILFLRSLSEGDKQAKRCIPKNSKHAKELLQYVDKFRVIKKEVQGLRSELGLEKNASGKIMLPSQDNIKTNPALAKEKDSNQPKVIKINRKKFHGSTSKQSKISSPINKPAPIPVHISGGVELPEVTNKTVGHAIPTVGTGNFHIARTVNQAKVESISTIVGHCNFGDVPPKVESKYENFNLTQAFVIDNTASNEDGTDKGKMVEHSNSGERKMDQLFDKMEKEHKLKIEGRSSTPPRKVIVRSRSRSPRNDPFSRGSRPYFEDKMPASNKMFSSTGQRTTFAQQSSKSFKSESNSCSISARKDTFFEERSRGSFDHQLPVQGLFGNRRLDSVDSPKKGFLSAKQDIDKTMTREKASFSNSSQNSVKDESRAIQKGATISRTIKNTSILPRLSSKNDQHVQSQSKLSANQNDVGQARNNTTVDKNLRKKLSDVNQKKKVIKPIKFGIKKMENNLVLSKKTEAEIIFGGKKKVFISERKFNHSVYFTGTLKTKVGEFKGYIKDILAQNQLNYLYDIDLYDAGVMENVLEKSLQFNKKFSGSNFTKQQAFFLIRQIFQDVDTRSTLQDDIIEMIESREDSWKLINWNTFTQLQKQTFEILNTSFNPNVIFNDDRKKEITRKLDLLFPQYHGDAQYLIKIWSWENNAKQIIKSLCSVSCKDLPPLEKIRQNEAGANKLYIWLSTAYNCPPFKATKSKNETILSTIICQGLNLQSDWIITTISDWWAKGYYNARYKEVEDKEEKRNSESDFNMEGMMIIDDAFSDGDNSIAISEDIDALENLNHETEYSEDRSGAPTIFLY